MFLIQNRKSIIGGLLLCFAISIFIFPTVTKGEHIEDAFIRGIPTTYLWNYSGFGPTPNSIRLKNFLDNWKTRGGLVTAIGIGIQQMYEDYPEYIEFIKENKVPVTRYPNVGHVEPCPVGRLRDLAGLSLQEAIIAVWEYETRTLIPNWHLEDGKLVLGNPRAGMPITFEELPLYNIPQEEYWLYGGTLAMQVILGVTPMNFDQPSLQRPPRERSYTNPVQKALGMDNWANPDGSQWDPENSPLEFYKREYGISSFREVLEMPCPVEKILGYMTKEEKDKWKRILAYYGEKKKVLDSADYRDWELRLLTNEEKRQYPDMFDSNNLTPLRETPNYFLQKEKIIYKNSIQKTAEFLENHWKNSDEYISPPMYVPAGGINLSLSEAYQTLAFSLEYFAIKEILPEKVAIKDILGPIDYPLKEEGIFGQELAEMQGLSNEYENTTETNILTTAWRVSEFIRKEGFIPSRIKMFVPVSGSKLRPVEEEKYINPAELLCSMAREYMVTIREKIPGFVTVSPAKIIRAPGITKSIPIREISHREINSYWSYSPDKEPGIMRDFNNQDEKSVSRQTILEIANYLVERWPSFNHDGDLGGPPDYVEAGGNVFSIAESFQALAFALEAFSKNSALPDRVIVKELLGPVDYPMYELPVEPRFDPDKKIGGWQPYELRKEYFPDEEIIKKQGIDYPSGGWGKWRNGRAKPENIFAAAVKAAKMMRETEQIPSMIPMILPLGITEVVTSSTADRAGSERKDIEVIVNPAELLYVMASEVQIIGREGNPGVARMTNVKIIFDQPCRSVNASSPVAFRGGRLSSYMATWDKFLWRGKVSRWLINKAWNYTP